MHSNVNFHVQHMCFFFVVSSSLIDGFVAFALSEPDDARLDGFLIVKFRALLAGAARIKSEIAGGLHPFFVFKHIDVHRAVRIAPIAVQLRVQTTLMVSICV